MKKLITSVVVAAICSTAAYAQPMKNDSGIIKKSEIVSKEKLETISPESRQQAMERKEERMERMPPERKERMEARREKFKSLTPEKQKAVKTEMKRHREEMKKITGEDPHAAHRKVR